MTERKAYRLSQLCASIQKAIETAVRGQRFWVTCEVARVNKNGRHRYLELVETVDNETIAKIDGVLWGGSWERLEQKYGDELSDVVAAGNKVLVDVYVDYKPKWGLRLSVYDVDLAYTYGDIELRKQQTLKKLDELGLLEKNGLIALPRVIQKIGVVASPNTSGLADFEKQLDDNPYHIRFLHQLFPTGVQGESAVPQIIASLEEADTYDFDAVVLIRGGGSKVDLDVFNSFELCATIANMRLPVLTGIGHETDTSVADEVANSNLKTPTAVADFIIVRASDFSARIKNGAKRIGLLGTRNLGTRRDQLSSMSSRLASTTNNVTGRKRYHLVTARGRIAGLAKTTISRNVEQTRSIRASIAILAGGRLSQREPLTLRELRRRLAAVGKTRMDSEVRSLTEATRRLDILKPANTLQRGYSITRDQNRRPLLTHDQVEIGDMIRTDLATFSIFSKVNSVLEHGTVNGVAEPGFRFGAELRKGDERARGDSQRTRERPGPDRRVGGEGRAGVEASELL